MTETNETAIATEEHTHEHHDHEGHHHSHDGHQHGPSLNPELTREIAVEVPADVVAKSFKSVVKRYQKLARIPGFRSGKVPESLVRSKFSNEIRQEVLEGLVGERFRESIDQQKLKPVSQPQIVDLKLNDGEALHFKAAFEVMPEIDVTGYETIKIAKPDTALSEDEYNAELQHILDGHATVEAVDEDRALADGDWAEIQFKGEIKDLAQIVTEEGATSASKEAPVTGDDVLIEIGGKNTLPAFDAALKGAKPGQELTFEVDYPAEFGERRLAGKTVAYDVTVKAIKRKIYPERTEEFAKQLGDYENFAEFETKLREHTADRKRQGMENHAKDALVEALLAKYQFPVPESLVQQQIDQRLDRGLRALAQQGMRADDMRKLDFGKLREAQRDQAVNEVRASMLLDKIADAENIQVNEEDMERELLMASIQAREPLDTLRQRLTQDGTLNRIREQLRRERTGQALYEKLAA